MHWRLQKILHGLSAIKAALFHRRSVAVVKGAEFTPEAVAGCLQAKLIPVSEGILKVWTGQEAYYIRSAGSDAAVLHEIFVKKEYRILTEFIRLNALPVKTIVDVGANIGLAARYFQQQFAPAIIHCLEPHADNAAMAKRNLQGPGSFRLHQTALWHKEVDVLHLHRHFRDGQDWAIAASEKSGSLGAGVCSAVTMRRFMEREHISHIDLLKIDIEGAEVTLFSPDADTGYLQQVSLICVELHKEVSGYKKMFDTFKQHGFMLLENDGICIGYRP